MIQMLITILINSLIRQIENTLKINRTKYIYNYKSLQLDLQL